ncbi:cell division protein FtsZ [Ketogulonicigenium vulgare]|uniref:Cell division protein FtsZ n=1 Tax=Ketogulonicigenium vulgare (strain WSH-001) TaxID=759362 RepID=F9Y7B9_KETVW|nr:cell division protein FtsZ [Ketogulonicigenium vulgare]ADO42860.1 conserved hypothetical protein [Ketogulonicigenium vulgare Y25]AEM41047.1 Cell division protein FtsZ [Ketogulonicigenium vulgare WSH-001]ALJ81193.1 cell division protein FtsZ [Ketogulonicigenium vulgare]ANW33936.1 DUF4177 domain-containing protein [Ketogulonicigenium vulgare]AOZ54773.1 hypothetical protein KVC_1760 [Ketogulonicigenium vulgare]
MSFEYRVIPAPRRAEKYRGAKTTEDRFTRTIEGLMNEMAVDGWEYQRADSLPCEERRGLTGHTTVYQTILVFRRAVAEAATPVAVAPAPIVAAAPPVPAVKAAAAPAAPPAVPRVAPAEPAAAPAMVASKTEEPRLSGGPKLPPLKAD